MPIYPLRCPKCQHTFEEFANMADRDKIPCPKCGCKRCETQYDQLRVSNGNLEFSDGESRVHWFHPDDVQYFRQRLGTNCIQHDGRVIFKNRQEQQRFQKAYDNYERKDLERTKIRRTKRPGT